MDDTYSDHIATYVRWMSVLTYWMLIFGIGCSVLTFLPDNLVFVWVLSSVPFYIYLYVSYQNYMLFMKPSNVPSKLTRDRIFLRQKRSPAIRKCNVLCRNGWRRKAI